VNITVWTKPKGIFTLTLGAIVLLSPSWFFGIFGLELDAAAEVVGRMYSGAFFLIGLGVLKVSGPENFDKNDALIAVVGDGVFFLVALAAQLMGLMNTWGWFLVIAGFFSCAGFFWCYLQVKNYQGAASA
jgi:hypothetical protein